MRFVVWGVGILAGLIAAAGVAAICAYFLFTCSPPPVAAPTLPAAAASPGEPTNPDGSTNWRARTLIDLAAMRQTLWDNTPIPFDAENERYRQWAIKGFAEAEARASKVTNYAGYFFTLAAYANGFNDPHIAVNLTGAAPPARHPGFVASASGEGAIVSWRAEEEGAPPLGAKIISCDGEDIQTLLAARLYPFRFNPALAEDRRRAVTRFFLDRGNPFGPAPQSCVFEAGGAQTESALAWRAAPPDEDPWWRTFQAAGTGPGADWGVSKPEYGVYWIGVPTFASGDGTSPRLDVLIKDVAAIGKSMRGARAIVIDTRGNGGGNSWYGDRLAEAIFSTEVLKEHKAPARQTATDWRGSIANADYWASEAERQKAEFGRFSINRGMSLFLAWQMRQTSKSAMPIWREGRCKTAQSGGWSEQRPKPESLFPAKVYFLSNGSCGSSCLNFADRVLMVPGVKLIGADTSGDGAYMEVRSETLPSGLAEIVIPLKVVRGAGRGALESYKADVVYDGHWDDASVRTWTLKVIAEEQARAP